MQLLRNIFNYNNEQKNIYRKNNEIRLFQYHILRIRINKKSGL